MNPKINEHLRLAAQTAGGITRHWESQTDVLTTASRLYKYRFGNQLMIYAQCPDATACAAHLNSHEALLANAIRALHSPRKSFIWFSCPLFVF